MVMIPLPIPPTRIAEMAGVDGVDQNPRRDRFVSDVVRTDRSWRLHRARTKEM